MNKKERTVLYFLCVTFLIGAGVSFIKHYREQKKLNAITIRNNDTTIEPAINFINKESSDISETIQININTASIKELDALPGIGLVLAQRIIDYRQKNGSYKNIEELLKVSGIDTKKLANLKDKITIK